MRTSNEDRHKRLLALTDEEIDFTDVPEVDPAWLDAARRVAFRPAVPKEQIALRVDRDVLEFFRSQGRGYQTRMNAVLRAFMESQKP